MFHFLVIRPYLIKFKIKRIVMPDMQISREIYTPKGYRYNIFNLTTNKDGVRKMTKVAVLVGSLRKESFSKKIAKNVMAYFHTNLRQK